MGRIVTPTYRLEMSGSTPIAWKGKATQKRLEKYVQDFAKSMEVGGANEHIAKHFGYIPYPVWARLVRQSTGEVVAEWRAGAFQIW